ncbi:hypothetical protein XA68_11831 [Ophiocordyceps unilateralis]|uniref:Uncharacterized protein n=1 Tax=Ophiocordyceps unilateralis TaxID=268505 RepID=A0A2A9PN73_OPHUN|nr:hypothetical protein XA68_11831 [Ophiocordyceps unilateralis]
MQVKAEASGKALHQSDSAERYLYTLSQKALPYCLTADASPGHLESVGPLLNKAFSRLVIVSIAQHRGCAAAQPALQLQRSSPWHPTAV